MSETGTRMTNREKFHHLPSIVEARGAISRYRSLGSLRERLEARLRRDAAFSERVRSRFGQESIDPFYPVPAPWQAILAYLSRQGILSHPRVTFDPLFPDDPKLYQLRLWAYPSKTDGYTEISGGGYSRGVSQDFGEALSKVVGELLERHALSIYRDEDLYRSSIRVLREKRIHFLDPRMADHSSSLQKGRYPSRVVTEDSIFRFVKGESLTHHREAFIPAQLVYLNYRAGEGEPIIKEANSNGAGGFFTRTGAILSGFYELIQRDAFLRLWLLREEPSLLNLSSCTHPELLRLLRDCRRYELEPHLLAIPNEFGVSVTVAVLLDRTGRGPAVALGGGCGVSREKTMLRALTEAIGVRSWLRSNWDGNQRPAEPLGSVEPFSKDFGQRDRQFLWCPLSALEHIGALIPPHARYIDVERDGPPVSPARELESLLAISSSKGPEYEVFAYKASNEILATLGYHSVRVCIPALLSLYMRETFAPLGAVRLRPYGYLEGERQVQELPHPFP